MFVANESGNLILEISERSLEFYQRAGYHPIADPHAQAEVPAAPPVELPEPEPLLATPEPEDLPAEVALEELDAPAPKKAVKRG
jgi:hypothetical protein